MNDVTNKQNCVMLSLIYSLTFVRWNNTTTVLPVATIKIQNHEQD
jgi:hypothetical protein